MGLRNSPHWSLQWRVRLKFEVYGDRKDIANPFCWDRVKFNLPGSRGYRSDIPWVMKFRKDCHLDAKIFMYMDDSRATGHCRGLTWRVARAYGSRCTRRGIQDTSR